MPRSRVIDEAWLRERYPWMTDINELLADHEREFGWRPSKSAVYTKANRLGIHRAPVDGRDGRRERLVRWSREPEMSAWMLENDHGQRVDLLSYAFRERFGFGLTRGQINIFRASHGTQTKRNHRGGRTRVPVGSERESKDGYIIVKVAEHATVPMSKDNWRLKHVHVWEQANGPLPEGHCVYFADGDNRNFDPANLVAVPNRLVGQMNVLKSEGAEWCDADSLRAVMAMAEIRIARNEAIARQPRTCKYCGKSYTNWERYKAGGSVKSTVCPECGAKHRKPYRFDRNEMRSLRAQGLTRRQIAERMGCNYQVVCRVLREVET